jgi:DNA-binding transcriptional MocR family regulator
LIIGEVGRGTYVAAQSDDLAIAPRSVIDMTINRPPNDGAARHFANALRSLSKRRDLRDLLGIEPANGWLRHRSAAAKWIQRRGLDVGPAEVLASNGVQHALSVVLTAFTQPGDVIAAEELNYPGVRMLADLNRLRLAGIPMDTEGLQPDKLEALCRRQRIRLLICSPTAHNPTTVSLSLKRRSEIAALARKHDFLIIENDILGMMPLEPLPALSDLARERSCYITGLTKVAGAGFRLAFIAAAPALLDRLTRVVHGTTWMPPPLLFEIFTLWLEERTLDDIVAWHRREIAARIALAAKILPRGSYSSNESAYHLWLEVPTRVNAEQFEATLRARGVLVVPGVTFAVNGQPVADNRVRVSLGVLNDRARVERGLSLVRETMARFGSAATQ